jgi:L-ascorbate metabolism protein UlaG (beta-lactamase superfamily)
MGAFLLAVLAAGAAPAQPVEIRARFIGNMAFQLTDGRATLRTDFPYESGYAGYMTWAETLVPPASGDALCLITHAHRDHFAAELAPRFCQRIVGPADTRTPSNGQGVAMDRPIPFGSVVVTPRATPHARLEHYSYLVEWSGLRLFFTGDTEDASELLRQRELDVAFVSPWLLRAVASAGRRIDARRIVVYHHGPNEAVPAIQGREVPRQGDELVFRSGGYGFEPLPSVRTCASACR